MQEHLAAFLIWVELHQDWAAPTVFLLAFLESLPLLGFFIPGTAVILGVGLLIAADVVPAWPAVLAAMTGAALGDSTGYMLSRRLGPGLVRRHLPPRWRRVYARAVLGFRRWGWWAVFISRFFAPLRAFVPVVAGLSHMSQSRFQSANIPSAILWAPLVLMPGYAFGWLANLLQGQEIPALLALAGAASLILVLRLRPVRKG